MDWQKFDAEKPPSGVFLVAKPDGNDDAPGYIVVPGRLSDLGTPKQWNGEPIPADSLIAQAGELPKRVIPERSGTHVIEDGVDKGPLHMTPTDKALEERQPEGIRQPEARKAPAQKPATKKKA